MHTPPKIAIIGMGYLMEYLLPCYTLILGGSQNLADNVVATTMDSLTIEDKRRRLPFPILLGQNAKALDDIRPDIILFAPPPDAVPHIAEAELAPYFDQCRRRGRPLPEIYAFPPSPHADYYPKMLGPGVAAVNFIPKTESGKKGEELTMLSFSGGWGQAGIDRLMEFCSPMGGAEAMEAAEFYSQLGCRCVANIMPWVFFTAQDRLARQGLEVGHAQMAGHVLAWLEGRQQGDLARPLGDILTAITQKLRQSICGYMAGRGFDLPRAQKMVDSKLRADMELCIKSARMDIVRQVKCYATKGGISEIVMLEYGTLLEGGMQRLFDGYPAGPDDDFFGWLDGHIITMCRHASHRAATLHEALPMPDFGRQHVQAMAGLILDAARQYSDEATARALAEAIDAAAQTGDFARDACAVYHAANRWLCANLEGALAGDIISEGRLAFGRRYGQGAAYLPIQRQAEFL